MHYPGRVSLAAALLVALAFVTVSLLPSVFQQLDSTHPFRGVRLLSTDADMFHAARAREAYDGYMGIGNAFLSTPKDIPSLLPVFPEQIIATVAKIIRIDTVGVMFFLQALLSLLTVLLLAAFAYSVTGRSGVSVVAAAVTVFAASILTSPWDIAHIFSPDFRFGFVPFTHNLEAQWSIVWLLLTLLALSEWMQGGQRKFIAYAALCLVILIYSTVYAGTFALLAAFFLTAWYIGKRDLKRLSELAVFWMAVVALATPHFLHLYFISGHPAYVDAMARLGLVTRTEPVIIGVGLVAFAVVSFFSRKTWHRTWPLLPILVLAGFLVLNHHLVTGFYYMPHRYHWYVLKPLILLFLSALVLSTLADAIASERARQVTGGILITLCVLFAGYQQKNAYGGVSPLWGRFQQAAPALKYIREHMGPGQVVYARDRDLARAIPVFSGADVYSAPGTEAAMVSMDRLRDGYFFDLWIDGLRPEQAESDFLGPRRAEISARVHGLAYREGMGAYTSIPDNLLRAHAAEYRSFARLSMEDKLSKYPIHAIFAAPHDARGPAWESFLACGKSVFASGGYDVLMMRPANEPVSCF